MRKGDVSWWKSPRCRAAFILFAFSFLSHSKKPDIGQRFLLRIKATTNFHDKRFFFRFNVLLVSDIQLWKIRINVLLAQVFNYHRKYLNTLKCHYTSWRVSLRECDRKKNHISLLSTMIIARYSFELLKRQVGEIHKNIYTDRRIINVRYIFYIYNAERIFIASKIETEIVSFNSWFWISPFNEVELVRFILNLKKRSTRWRLVEGNYSRKKRSVEKNIDNPRR